MLSGRRGRGSAFLEIFELLHHRLDGIFLDGVINRRIQNDFEIAHKGFSMRAVQIRDDLGIDNPLKFNQLGNLIIGVTGDGIDLGREFIELLKVSLPPIPVIPL